MLQTSFQNMLTSGSLCCATLPFINDTATMLPEISAAGLNQFARRLNALEAGKGAEHKLAEIGYKTVPVLIDTLITHPEPQVRRHATWALSIIRDPTALPALIHTLGNYDPIETCDEPERGVLYCVFWALKQIPHPQSIEPLLPFATSHDVAISARAVSAMAHIYFCFEEELMGLFAQPPYSSLVATVMRHLNT